MNNKKLYANISLVVKKYYPKAKVIQRPTGKEYYQVVDEEIILGQGKSKEDAWTAAYHNLDK